LEKIGIIGGDQRQIYVKQFLEEHGWQTETAFFPDGTRQEETTERLREIFENCRFVILPVPVLRKGKLNTGAEYKPDAEQLMEYVKHGQCIFGGCFSKELKNRILCRGGESYDLMQLERIVRENAAATAEGAVAEAVQNSPVTLRGSLCILTGYGRCGSAIHQCLKNWGCTIVVYDRDENACERAKEAGAKICEYKDLSKVLKKAAFLFNTAPSAVWTEGLLEGVPQEVCILELASMPGGIDRDAADRLGIHINVLPGLPGRFAPCTSGRLLGEEILKEIERIIKRECKS